MPETKDSTPEYLIAATEVASIVHQSAVALEHPENRVLRDLTINLSILFGSFPLKVEEGCKKIDLPLEADGEVGSADKKRTIHSIFQSVLLKLITQLFDHARLLQMREQELRHAMAYSTLEYNRRIEAVIAFGSRISGRGHCSPKQPKAPVDGSVSDLLAERIVETEEVRCMLANCVGAEVEGIEPDEILDRLHDATEAKTALEKLREATACFKEIQQSSACIDRAKEKLESLE